MRASFARRAFYVVSKFRVKLGFNRQDAKNAKNAQGQVMGKVMEGFDSQADVQDEVKISHSLHCLLSALGVLAVKPPLDHRAHNQSEYVSC